jgi:threonine/homoserine/homoserine lactone efflux protein
MYLDIVAVAGIVTVLLVVVFFVGFGVFTVRDQKANGLGVIKVAGKATDKPL